MFVRFMFCLTLSVLLYNCPLYNLYYNRIYLVYLHKLVVINLACQYVDL